MSFSTKVSVSWTIDQWWCNRVVDYTMQRVDQSCGAASPCFKLLNPIKRDATKKTKHVFSEFSLCECNYCDRQKNCMKS